ncbi:MAG: cytochrome c oxidase subunit 3 [Anaerolineae bacterium]
MTVTAIPHGHAEEHNRPAMNRLGLWLFILSESMIFLILLTARFYLFGTSRPEGLSQLLGLGVTVILLLSSLTAYLAESSIAHDDRESFLLYTLLTIILGTMFLAGVVGLEWPQAIHEGIVPQRGFGIAYFSMTGMHAFHVLTGVLLLLVIYWNGARGGFSAEKHWGVEATVKYWHFVDVVWVFFYPALYLLS